jgi:solute carrier family 35 (UDP-galactose transporter), member B1
VLGKSVKPIPVMILGVILARKRYTWQKYMFVLMITAGVALFMYKPSESQSKTASNNSVFGWGEILLVSIIFSS